LRKHNPSGPDRFDRHSSSGVCPREDVRSWRAWGRSSETAMREWVKHAERDAGAGRDGGLTSSERKELAELRAENRRLREDVEILKRVTAFFELGDPVNCYSFIEAKKALHRRVKRACELLEVSRAAYYAARAGQPSGRAHEDTELTARITAGASGRKAGTARRGSTRSCVGRAGGIP
jgi:hypothetical protein